MQKGVLHQVPQLVECFVIRTLLLSALFRRDDNTHPATPGPLDNLVAVIPFIRQQILCRQPFDKFASLCTICCGTCCDKYSERHTMRIHGQVQFGIEPPFVRPMS